MIFEFIFSIVPGIAWVLGKAWLLFAVFVWIRASLHRVRTDQILEFGWQWLLPLSIVNLGLAIFLRVWVWDSGWGFIWVWDSGWGLIAPIIMILMGVVGFVILVVDEDKEALENMRRPYSTYIPGRDPVKASPGIHNDSEVGS